MILEQNPDNPGLLGTLGTLFLETGRIGLAISFLHRAAEKLPQADILCNLAIAYKQSGQHEKVFSYFKKAIKNKPTADILGNYAGLFVNYGTPDEAIKQANKAIKLDPQCQMAHWNKSLALLEKGEWKEGWEEHEWGLKNGVRTNRHKDIPYWDGTKGKTVLVYGEQGLGDEIMFASMLPDMMKDNTVILESHKRLKHLFEESFPGLIVYGTREDAEIEWRDNHRIDFRVPIGSLGRWFRNSKQDFPGTPYLKAEGEKPKKFRVGISWTGGLKPGRIHTRSVPLQLWGSILGQDCEFVSLQYTDCEKDIEETERMFGIKIKQYDAVKADDYCETAKLVKSCDLVISCCTSVIHLAGALGVPCWVMVPNKPAWRYGVKRPICWYRSVRMYRQPEGGKEMWLPVLERIGLDLSDLLKEKSCNSFIPKATIENTEGMSLQTASL